MKPTPEELQEAKREYSTAHDKHSKSLDRLQRAVEKFDAAQREEESLRKARNEARNRFDELERARDIP